MVEIFHRAIFCTFRSEFFSLPTAFSFICNALFILVPLIILGYGNINWVRVNSVNCDIVQTKVNTNNVLLLATLKHTTSGRKQQEVLTFRPRNLLSGYRLPALSGQLSIDIENEILLFPPKATGLRRSKSLEITLRLLNGAGNSLDALKMIVGIECLLKPKYLRALKVTGLGIIEFGPIYNASEVRIGSDLIVKQSTPIPFGQSNLQRSQFPSQLPPSFDKTDLARLLMDYAQLNVSLQLGNTISFAHGRLESLQTPVTIRLSVHLPPQLLEFETSFLFRAKWFYIYYVCILIPFYWLIRRLQNYVFLEKRLFKAIKLLESGEIGSTHCQTHTH